MDTYDISFTERQRQILIQALLQFRIENCPEEIESTIRALPVDAMAEEDPNEESMTMAAILKDQLSLGCLNSLYI